MTQMIADFNPNFITDHHRIMCDSTHRHVGTLEEDVSFPARDIYSCVFSKNEIGETSSRNRSVL